jgi:hypothetical protein
MTEESRSGGFSPVQHALDSLVLGLDPGAHANWSSTVFIDGRVKPGHDGGVRRGWLADLY